MSSMHASGNDMGANWLQTNISNRLFPNRHDLWTVSSNPCKYACDMDRPDLNFDEGRICARLGQTRGHII